MLRLKLDIGCKHIAAARAGSTESWTAISLNTDKIPLENLNEVLDLFVPIFDTPDGFEPSAPLPESLNARYEKIKLCLHGLAFVGLRVSNEPNFLRTLSSSWSKISKWAQYFFVDKCSTDSNSTQEEQAAEERALALLSSYSSSSSPQLRMRSQILPLRMVHSHFSRGFG